MYISASSIVDRSRLTAAVCNPWGIPSVTSQHHQFEVAKWATERRGVKALSRRPSAETIRQLTDDSGEYEDTQLSIVLVQNINELKQRLLHVWRGVDRRIGDNALASTSMCADKINDGDFEN